MYVGPSKIVTEVSNGLSIVFILWPGNRCFMEGPHLSEDIKVAYMLFMTKPAEVRHA